MCVCALPLKRNNRQCLLNKVWCLFVKIKSYALLQFLQVLMFIIIILQSSGFVSKAIDIAASELIAVATSGEGIFFGIHNYI